jgi:hypothetical protein
MCLKVFRAIGYRRSWINLKKTYHISGNEYIIILPDDDENLNVIALQLIPSFLDKKYVNKAIVVVKITTYNLINSLAFSNDSRIRMVGLSDSTIRKLIKYYCLIKFAKNILVVSTKMPFGSAGLLKMGKMNFEDFVKDTYFV